MLNFIRALCAIFFFAALSACGGGGGGSASAPSIDTPAPPTVNPQPPAPPSVLPRDFAAASAGAVAQGNASRRVIAEVLPLESDGMVSIAIAGVTATGTHASYFVQNMNGAQIEVNYAEYILAIVRERDAVQEECGFYPPHTYDRETGITRPPSPVSVVAYINCTRRERLRLAEFPTSRTATISADIATPNAAASVITTAVPDADINVFAVITAMGQSANISGNLHQATTGLHNVNLPLAEGMHVVHSHYDCLHSTVECYRWLRGNGRQGDEANGQAAELAFVNHVANNDVAYVWVALPTQTNTRAAGFWASAPRAFPQLRGKWIVAAAANVAAATVNNDVNLFAALRDRNASCYGIGDWCLVANAETPHEAAAKTSGALALLKQRSYDAPMSVLVNILLETADEVRSGARDNTPALQLFGRGILNTEAAMAAADNMRMAGGLSFAQAEINLPPMLRGLARSLQDETIAVRYLQNRYYDHPLAGFVGVEDAPPLHLDSGDIWHWQDSDYEDGMFFAAYDGGGKLRNAGMRLGALELRHSQHSANSALTSGDDVLPFFAVNGGGDMQMRLHFGGGFSGFAANGDDYRQSGVLFSHDFGRFGIQSSFSRINENGTLFGGKWDGIAPLLRGGESMQTRAKMAFAINDKWQLFAAAEQAQTKAQTGGIIGRIDGLRAFGWQAGAAAKHIFHYGDRLRFGITQETAISDGAAILHLRQSTPEGWRIVERPVQIAGEKHHTIAAGYGFASSAKTKWSIAAAYRIGDEARAHLQWQTEL